MIISQNPLVRSWLNVAVFWYFGFYLTLGIFHNATLLDLPWFVLSSVIVSFLGLAAGFGSTYFLSEHSLIAVGDELKAGSSSQGVILTMGPQIVAPTARMSRKAPTDILGRQPWWEPICDRSPGYANAIEQVMRVMWTAPRLPASAVPGGHGGRSLVEHSLAVAMQMLKEAQTWEYVGQRDKRGNIRVPLSDPSKPHRFTGSDGPLLVLTALAHDIGKVSCYEPEKEVDPGRTSGPVLKVREVRLKHDILGGRLLRTVPAIQALPLEDRIAVITAVSYYHHPFALPIASWVDDRIRSLTELLIKADVATGMAEGNAQSHDHEYESTEDGQDVPEEDGKRRTGALAAPVAQVIEDDDDPVFQPGKTAATAPPERPAAVSSGSKRTAQHETYSTTPPPETNVPRELGLFMAAARSEGGINGLGQRGAGSRIAWKVGDTIYVIDTAMRRIITNRAKPEDVIWAGEACADSPNGSQFTRNLLSQLDASGALIREVDGKTYPATRAMFKVGSPNGRDMTVFLVHTSAIPGAGAIADAKPMRMIGPLWGEQSAFRQSAVAAPTAAKSDDERRDAPVSLEDTPIEDLSADSPASTSPPDLASADLRAYMLGDAPAPTATESPNEPSTDANVSTDIPDAADPVDAPVQTTKAQAGPYLIQMISSPQFLARPDLVIRETEEGRRVYVPADSDTGHKLTGLLTDLGNDGFDTSAVRRVVTDDGKPFYLFVLPQA